MIKCPNCGRENADNFNFCLDCGFDLKAFRETLPATQVPPPSALSSLPPAATLPPPARDPATVPPSSQAPVTAPTPGLSQAPPVAPGLPPPPPGLPPPPPVAAMARPITMPPAPPSSAFVAAPVAPPPVAPAAPPAPAAPIAPAPPIAAPAAPPPPAPVNASAIPAAAGPTCPACGFGNAPGVRFCGSCGTRIDGAPASSPPQDAGPARTMFMHAQVEPQRVVKLITIDQTGREGMTFTLRAGETLCGRTNGIVLFDDPYVSPTHCRFVFQGGRLVVHDIDSLNGVYLRIRVDRKLEDGDFLRVGRQLYRFEHLTRAAVQVKAAANDDSKVWGSPLQGAFGRIVQILDDGRTGEIRLLQGERVQLGRELGDIVMPWDGFVSGRHCVFARQGADVVLADLGSSNGTYVRIRKEAELVHGDFLLVGNQMLRVEIA